MEASRSRPRPEELLEELSVPSVIGARPSLERMRALVAALGDPQSRLRVIHVGGTSGKGSTAAIAARILQEAGLRVGLHTKPHLQSVEERFVVDGAPIAADRLSELLEHAAPAAREVRPSWFELTAALAFEHFARSEVDVAVVEVGLGGTFDATNVVRPAVAVLTNVGLDHTEVLGDTVEQIAADKVGIVKRGCLAVSGVTQSTVRTIVKDRCRAEGATLWLLGREVRLRVHDLAEDGARLDLAGPTFRHEDLVLGLVGAHQAQNAAIAVAAAHAFVRQIGLLGGELPDEAVRRALARVRVPGRIERFRLPAPDGQRRIVLDGAHNPDKMAALAAALRTLFRWRRLVGVVAFKQGHDHRASLAAIAPLLDHVVLTRFSAETDYGRDVAQPPETLQSVLSEIGTSARVEMADDPAYALQVALDVAGPDDLVVVTGSLYLVGAVRPWVVARAAS